MSVKKEAIRFAIKKIKKELNDGNIKK